MAKKRANAPKGASFKSAKKTSTKRKTTTKLSDLDDAPPIGVKAHVTDPPAVPPIAPAPETTTPAATPATPHVKRQAGFEGDGFDLPPAIQSIENAADELFEVLDSLTALKERRETLKVNIQGLMRAAKRKIYMYRDRTIRIEDIEKVKLRAPKHRKSNKRVRGVKVERTHTED